MPSFIDIFSGNLYFDALIIELFYGKEEFSLCNTVLLVTVKGFIRYLSSLILLLFYLFFILRYEKLVDLNVCITYNCSVTS